MSRADISRLPGDNAIKREAAEPSDRVGSDNASGDGAGGGRARVAEDLGLAALKLAVLARNAGLTTLGYLLEAAALEAGAEAASVRGMNLPGE